MASVCAFFVLLIRNSVHPVFLRNATALATSSPQDSPVDLFEFCQKAVSEAMVLIIFGKVRMSDAFARHAKSNCILKIGL